MTRTPLILAALIALPLAGPAPAQGVFVPPPATGDRTQLTGLRSHVASELPRYGLGDVDTRDLSNRQVALINTLIHSSRSHGDIAARIRGVLRRGFLQRTLDRL